MPTKMVDMQQQQLKIIASDSSQFTNAYIIMHCGGTTPCHLIAAYVATLSTCCGYLFSVAWPEGLCMPVCYHYIIMYSHIGVMCTKMMVWSIGFIVRCYVWSYHLWNCYMHVRISTSSFYIPTSLNCSHMTIYIICTLSHGGCSTDSSYIL